MNYAIILAGGIGKRFWPLSRAYAPKQFIKIKGNFSLLQDTLKRINSVIAHKNIFIVTNKAYLSLVKDQVKQFAIPNSNIILEPRALNTAPAVSVCARLIGSKDKNAVLLILPCDHYIKSNKRFRQDILKAIDIAKGDFLVAIGVKPNCAHTGYGYIRRGASLGRGSYRVRGFIEKPAISKAKKIYRKKDIFWNAGIFCWRADVFLEELKRYQPAIHSQIAKINNKQKIKRFWPKIRPVSVDYAVLEKSKRIVLIPARFDWSDLGSWDALYEIFPKDKNKNIIAADCFSLDTKQTIILAKTKRLIAAVGLKNLIVIDTPDALLVCGRNKSQDIKTLFDCLERKKRKECLEMPCS